MTDTSSVEDRLDQVEEILRMLAERLTIVAPDHALPPEVELPPDPTPDQILAQLHDTNPLGYLVVLEARDPAAYAEFIEKHHPEEWMRLTDPNAWAQKQAFGDEEVSEKWR